MSERFAYDETVYCGKICDVHRIGLRTEDGEVVQRDLIHFAGAACILPVLDDGRIVLIRNQRFAVGEELLELPAGMLEPPEPPEDCAARELTEETGFSAGGLEKLGEFFTIPGSGDERMHAYLATDLTAGEQCLEGHERIRVEIVAGDEVRRRVLDGRIHDAKTIATLSLWWLRQQQ
jgi:ADP-ribose pyrophosphatase